MDSIPLDFQTPTPSEALDFGRIIHNSPSLVLRPKAPQDISLLLKSISSSPRYDNLTVAARGAGHSTHGQAQALDGIVVDMTSLPKTIRIGKADKSSDGMDHFFVDVGAGVLWIEVLLETLKHGLTPRSWTDYLFLTVGGTLSVGGISGQAFKYGPQICNVLEMDVITGSGDFITCSKEKNADLFYGVLGGLGQFGIIIRARITLETASLMVKHIKILYEDFNKFTKDQELLISMEEVDYVEGFLKLSDNETLDDPLETSSERMTLSYTIEMAIYYDDAAYVQQTVDTILSQLTIVPSAVDSLDVSYFDFLNRVRQEEKNLRSNGLWEVPHPWLNIFVPRSQISVFKDLLIEKISATGTNGPVLIYPCLRNKWDPKMFMILPREDVGEDIFYIIGLLRSAIPFSSLQTLLKQNQKIIDAATSGALVCLDKPMTDYSKMGTGGSVKLDEDSEGKDVINSMEGLNEMGAKQYIPYCRDESEWRIHFGEEWDRFEALKSKYDPLNILTPGQNIFKRKSKET